MKENTHDSKVVLEMITDKFNQKRSFSAVEMEPIIDEELVEEIMGTI